ncbi:MAG: hypothetical protein KAS13_03020 [Candidatus Omnitrophica bacterium]|nr:hypothetical protein [Candidatus Omnitrophota bacterium]
MSEFKCPHCDNPINDEEALNCLYCGLGLERDTGFLSRLRYPGPRIIVLMIIMFIIISFILLIIW